MQPSEQYGLKGDSLERGSGARRQAKGTTQWSTRQPLVMAQGAEGQPLLSPVQRPVQPY